MSSTLWIVHTGTANLASVRAAFRRAGVEPRETLDPRCIEETPRLVLPGVGAFGAAMKNLHQAGVVDALKRRLEAGRATFAICLGMQILCESSEESPNVEGLGLIRSPVLRFQDAPRIPQFGWSPIHPPRGTTGILQDGYAYFAHSYRLLEQPAGWRCALAEYSGEFVAALEREGIVACQFHPELSGRWGQALLERWLSATAG